MTVPTGVMTPVPCAISTFTRATLVRAMLTFSGVESVAAFATGTIVHETSAASTSSWNDSCR